MPGTLGRSVAVAVPLSSGAAARASRRVWAGVLPQALLAYGGRSALLWEAFSGSLFAVELLNRESDEM